MARDEFEDNDDRPRRRRSYDDDEYDRPPPPRKSNVGMILLIIGGVLLLVCGGGALVAIMAVRSAAKNIQQGLVQATQIAEQEEQAEEAKQNLKRIGVAIHQHSFGNGTLPNNSYEVRGNQSRPLLSWRVHLLPSLGEDRLYRQFKLNEPWDSPNNIRLLNQMPAVYQTTDPQMAGPPGKTYYRGFSHKGAIFEKPLPGQPAPRINMGAITDGTANTIFVVEAGEPVEWTKPEDLDWSPGRPRPSLGGPNLNRTSCVVLMGDGAVRRLRKNVPDQTLRWLIDRQDGSVIPPGWEESP